MFPDQLALVLPDEKRIPLIAPAMVLAKKCVEIALQLKVNV